MTNKPITISKTITIGNNNNTRKSTRMKGKLKVNKISKYATMKSFSGKQEIERRKNKNYKYAEKA